MKIIAMSTTMKITQCGFHTESFQAGFGFSLISWSVPHLTAGRRARIGQKPPDVVSSLAPIFAE